MPGRNSSSRFRLLPRLVWHPRRQHRGHAPRTGRPAAGLGFKPGSAGWDCTCRSRPFFRVSPIRRSSSREPTPPNLVASRVLGTDDLPDLRRHGIDPAVYGPGHADLDRGAVLLLGWAIDAADGLEPILNAQDRLKKEQQDFWILFAPGLTAIVGFWSTLRAQYPETLCGTPNPQRAQVTGQALGLPTTMDFTRSSVCCDVGHDPCFTGMRSGTRLICSPSSSSPGCRSSR